MSTKTLSHSRAADARARLSNAFDSASVDFADSLESENKTESATVERLRESVAPSIPAGLFPLPLTVFEEYMLLDDSTAYPMNFFRRLRFRGRLDVARWRRALELAVARHPLFGCNVRKVGRRYFWVPSDAPLAFRAIRREELAEGRTTPPCSAEPTPFAQTVEILNFDRNSLPTFEQTVEPVFAEDDFGGASRNARPKNVRRAGFQTDAAFDADAFFADSRPIRLATELPMRTTVVWDDESADVVFQCHHCVADGAGSEQLIADALFEYAVSTGALPADAPRPAVDFDALRRRGSFGLTLGAYFRNYYYTTVSTFRFLFAKPRPFLPESARLSERTLETKSRNSVKSSSKVKTPESERAKSARSVESTDKRERRDVVFQQEPANVGAPRFDERTDLTALTLTADETRRALQNAKKLGVTFNDLLVSAFCLAIDKRREKLGVPISGFDRLAIPINMRNEKHRDAPGCNIVTMGFLDLPSRRRKDAIELAREANRRLKTIKNRAQKYFLDLVLKTGRFLAASIGRDLSLFLRADSCRATATFSNLGRALQHPAFDRTEDGRIRVGKLVLNAVEDMPPIRNASVLSVATSTYGGKVRFGLRYDEKYLTRDEANDFLKDLRDATVDGF